MRHRKDIEYGVEEVGPALLRVLCVGWGVVGVRVGEVEEGEEGDDDDERTKRDPTSGVTRRQSEA